jgi:hypothetical protein
MICRFSPLDALGVKARIIKKKQRLIQNTIYSNSILNFTSVKKKKQPELKDLMSN